MVHETVKMQWTRGAQSFQQIVFFTVHCGYAPKYIFFLKFNELFMCDLLYIWDSPIYDIAHISYCEENVMQFVKIIGLFAF